MQEICSTSHLKVQATPRVAQHMRQHGKFENFWGQTAHQKGVFWRILWIFSGAFPELPSDLDGWFWCFLMSWRSLDHPRMILDRFGIGHFSITFSSKFWPKKSMKGGAFTHPEWIDLRVCGVIPNQNNVFKHEKNIPAQTNGWISRSFNFWGSK